MSRTVTILGAGAMGSALATPLRAAGHEVRLWGTWLDAELLDRVRQGEPHPRTGVPLAAGTQLFDHTQLEPALAGADLVILAVASVGAVHVTRLALPWLGEVDALLVTSKGFDPDQHGRVELLPDALRAMADQERRPLPPLIAVGGPCKANEVAAGRWTAAILAAHDAHLASTVAAAVATPTYRAEVSKDEAGVEVCAPMKNVYAIALGIADGLGLGGDPHHDLKAAAFAQAVRELMVLVDALGGDPATALGLAGVGDLEVTGLSGRNRAYGERIGGGVAATDALAAMEAEELTVEGVPAARLARDLVDQRAPERWSQLPLLSALLAVLDGAGDAAALVADAVLPVVEPTETPVPA